MTAAVRKLIEQARALKRTESISELDYCRTCLSDWPCLHARLADALEQEQADLESSEQHVTALENHRNGLILRALAAERRVAELERVELNHQTELSHCEQWESRASAAERQRDEARTACAELHDALLLAGCDQIELVQARYDRDEARALILAYAAWVRDLWPPDVIWNPKELALLDYAKGLEVGQ